MISALCSGHVMRFEQIVGSESGQPSVVGHPALYFYSVSRSCSVTFISCACSRYIELLFHIPQCVMTPLSFVAFLCCLGLALSFTCDNGHTVPNSYQCDTDNDCSDFSDEKECQAGWNLRSSISVHGFLVQTVWPATHVVRLIAVSPSVSSATRTTTAVTTRTKLDATVSDFVSGLFNFPTRAATLLHYFSLRLLGIPL